MDLGPDAKSQNVHTRSDIRYNNCDNSNEVCTSTSHGFRRMLPGNESSGKTFATTLCCTTMRLWWRSKFSRFEEFLHAHQWKVLSIVFLLVLFCLGLKMVTVDTDFDKLWIEESDRLISEWTYLAQALKRVSSQTTYTDQHYFSPDARRTRMMLRMNGARVPINPMLDPTDPLMPGYRTGNVHGSHSQAHSGPFVNSLPGREFMGTMETILQCTTQLTDPNYAPMNTYITSDTGTAESSTTTSAIDPQLLTPQALLDHMEFLVKVRRLQITVGSAKWSFRDLCQRAVLPFGSDVHPIQAYLDMIIPCMIITPLDCFWEGAKVLGPEEATWVPWLDERTLIQWPNLDPVGLLQQLRTYYGNQSHQFVDSLIAQFQAAGINHGYLNRTCLDPTDPACPVSAPNHGGKPPNVAQVLSGGCPSFAANVLHWPEEIIVGGREYENKSARNPFVTTDDHKNQNHSTRPVLIRASALQSLILLRSPRDLYEAVRHSDPYKHEGWTLSDAQHVLDEWRRNLRRLVMEHNVGLQPHNHWHFYAFTDNSLRDLLRELTLRLGPIKIVGCVLLVFLYGLVCLLGWRDPVRSQCWLALTGLLVAALSAVAGLGICAVIGLPFNVLTIQVLPFLLMGLGVDGLFTLTTCHDCCVARRATGSTSNSNASRSSSLTPWASSSSITTCSSGSTGTSSTYYSSFNSGSSYTAPVLAQHGPSLLYGSIAVAGAFFSAAYIPIPLMRQFCLQAGILVLVQSITAFILFPVLLQFDGIRRSQRRLDVLCCIRHPAALDATTTSLLRPVDRPVLPPISRATRSVHSRCHSDRRCNRTASNAVSSPPLVCAMGTRTTCTHTKHNTNTFAPGAPSSIQVSVINRITSTIKDHVTDVTCSGMSDVDVYASGHMVRATVTVQGLSDSTHPSNTTTTTTTATSKLDGSTPNAQCSTRTKKCCAAHFHPDSTDLMATQTSAHHCPTRPRASSNRTLVNRISFVERSSRPFSPLLVRFSRRIAITLTYHWSIQTIICLLGCGLFVMAGCVLHCCLHLGLDWASLTPIDTVEYGFVKASEKAFGLYNFQVIARGTDLPGSRPPPPPPPPLPSTHRQLSSQNSIHRLLLLSAGSTGHMDTTISGGLTRTGANVATIGRGIDFPMQQRRLQHLYGRLLSLPGVMLAGRQVWLRAMRDWLQHVQDAFDADRARGQITDQGEWSSNATELGVLGLRLIVQTDRGPELGRIKTGRLVRSGIVDPPAFYVLLRVWRTYDALNYSSLACLIHPEPMPLPLGQAGPVGPGHASDLYALPPAEPIEFVQTNFYAHGIRGMGVQLNLVQNVRHLTESATTQGVPTFPIGVPFTFAEHYLYLLSETGIAFGIFLSILIVTGLILFASPIIVLLLVGVGASGGVCAAICGLYLFGLELNPISIGLLLFSGGLGARLAAGFLGAWPDMHTWNRVDHTLSDGTKLCLCRRPGCSSAFSSQYCTAPSAGHQIPSDDPQTSSVVRDQPKISYDLSFQSSRSSKTNDFVFRRDCPQPQTASTASIGRLFSSRSRTNQRRQRARTELMRLMSNHLSPALHTTVSLILALALLAAARVQFIANYFFYLITFVSLVCLFNTIFLIPTLYYWLHPFKEVSFHGDYFLLRKRPPRASVEPCLRHLDSHSNGIGIISSAELPRTVESPPVSQLPVTLPSSISASSLSSSNGSAASSAGSTSSNSCHSPKSARSSPCLLPTTCATSDPQQSILLSQFDSPISDGDSFTNSRSSLAQSTSELYELCGVRLRDVTQSLHRNLNWLDTATAAAAVVAAAAAAVASASSTSPPRHSHGQPPSRPASLSTISEEPSHSSSTVSLNRISPSSTAGTSTNSNPSYDTTGSSAETGMLDREQLVGGASSVSAPHLLFDIRHLLTLNHVSESGCSWSKPPSEVTASSTSPILTNVYPTASSSGSSLCLSHKGEASPPPSYSSVISPQLPCVTIPVDPSPSVSMYDSASFGVKLSQPHRSCPTSLVQSTSSEYGESPVVSCSSRPMMRHRSSRSRLSYPTIPTTVRTNPRVRLELHHHHHHHHYGRNAPGNSSSNGEHRQESQQYTSNPLTASGSHRGNPKLS